MMKLLTFFFCLLASGINAYDVDAYLARINAHLLIRDARSAVGEAEKALRAYPNEESLHIAYIQALAVDSDQRELFRAWKRYKKINSDPYENHRVLENMAWSVIRKSSGSSSTVIRLYAALGAFYGQDMQTVHLLHKALRDSSHAIRAVVCGFCGQLHDQILQDEILHLVESEKVLAVRIAAIKAAGKMRMRKAKPALFKMIGSQEVYDELLAAAVTAIAQIEDSADGIDVAALVKQKRAGLRLLACELVMHFRDHKRVPLIVPLLRDRNPSVRAAALLTLGRLRVDKVQARPLDEVIAPLLDDSDERVAILAAWNLTLIDPEKGFMAMKPKLFSGDEKIRHFAAAVFASTGRYGVPYFAEVLDTSDDPIVKVNIAMGMVTQQHRVLKACTHLNEALNNSYDLWMTDEEAGFHIIKKSTVRHNPVIPQYPDAVDQMTRLEVLNALAVAEDARAPAAIKKFLAGKNWGISGTASILLLTEGDETAIELVEKLLEDPDDKLRIQAALVLAMWGHGDKGAEALQEAYHSADRQLKERILESLGKIGSESSIPFLVDRLQEKHASLRIIAASALLQALYH